MLNNCRAQAYQNKSYILPVRYLTFHSELLLDVLEVVGILGVDGTVGSCDRHIGVFVLVSGARQWYLFRFAIICEHFAGGVLSILKMTQVRLYFGDAGLPRMYLLRTCIYHTVCMQLYIIEFS